MCKECGYTTGHATMCPNSTPMVDEILADCALCGAEVDEETTTYGICEKCWTDYHNFENALAYGASNQESVKINGLYAKVLTPDQINEALKCAVMDMKKFYYNFTVSAANDFLSDDDGAFATWLKEQKGNE
jgi:hypothetical protein